ncbi:hypothetical protein F2Q70_00004504 [Brassica cretica]|uniref:Uncharacterized protein n=1 Tax=Brassica cretica TaxID=69181 RepID=A0A8S9J4A0_BRACR|nr:hypothetical protein F2Q70_00004504 [Brassica cretica]
MSRTWMIHPLLAKQRRCLVDHARDDQVDYKDRRNTNDQSKSERLAMRIAVRKAKKTIKKEAITLHPGQLQLAFPDQPARDPTAISSRDFNSSSFQLASVRGSLGGPVSTICKQKIIICGRVALLHPYPNLITTD